MKGAAEHGLFTYLSKTHSAQTAWHHDLTMCWWNLCYKQRQVARASLRRWYLLALAALRLRDLVYVSALFSRLRQSTYPGIQRYHAPFGIR